MTRTTLLSGAAALALAPAERAANEASPRAATTAAARVRRGVTDARYPGPRLTTASGRRTLPAACP